MTQETDKPKTLSLKKPLSLAKEAEIATLFSPPKKELEKPKVNEFFRSGMKTFHVAQGQDQPQTSNKVKSQPGKGERKHKPEKHISNGSSVAKDHSTPKDKKQKQASAKQSLQDARAQAKAVRKIALRKSEKKQARRKQEALTWLRETFPACFTLDSPQPLKIGIYDNIVQVLKNKETENLPSEKFVRKVLKSYVQNRLYHEVILTNPYRYDLEGNMAQEVTDEDRDYAKIHINF